MAQDHWLRGFSYNVKEWREGDHYEALAICRSSRWPALRSMKPSPRSRPAGS
jgi:hypothetical protein